MSRTHVRRAATCAFGFLTAGIVVLVACMPLHAQRAPEDPIPVTKEVVITVESRRVTAVKPQIAFVRPGGTLVFLVRGLSGSSTLEVDFHVGGYSAPAVKGPFVRYSEQEPKGRVTFKLGNERVALRYDEALKITAAWKYEIVLRDEKGDDVFGVDPMVIGKGIDP
jgi:hypothetical protein